MTDEIDGSGGGEIEIGKVFLQVVNGDITKETTDAIVNGTNNTLDFSIGMQTLSVSVMMPVNHSVHPKLFPFGRGLVCLLCFFNSGMFLLF